MQRLLSNEQAGCLFGYNWREMTPRCVNSRGLVEPVLEADLDSLPSSKTCTRCGESKPLDSFYRSKSSRDGRHSWCKSCHAARSAEDFQRNREVHRARHAAWLQANPEYMAEYMRNWRKQHPDADREIQRRAYENRHQARREADEQRRRGWRDVNRDKVRESNRKSHKRWRTTKPERASEVVRQSWAKHRDAYLEAKRKWREANPDRVLEYSQVRRARKVAAYGHFTRAEFRALCQFYGNVCLACGNSGSLTADHVIPLSRGGSDAIENIQPLCLSCNTSKGVKIIDYRPKAEVSV